MTRRLRLALLATLVFAGPLGARDAARVETAEVGKILLLKFPGNRDAGYRWRLNEAESRGLDLVTVRNVGWTISENRKSIFFAKRTSIMSISVMPKAAGEADLAFDYFRVWGNRIHLRTERVRVVIKPVVTAAQ